METILLTLLHTIYRSSCDLPEPSLMSDEERLTANKSAIKNLNDVRDHLNKTELAELDAKADKTFKELRWMIWITFVLGMGLIFTSIGLSITGAKVELPLGLGTLGVADWLALLAYKPMDRLQQASADFSEQIMIEASWIMSVNLYLIAMNVDKPETVSKAANDIITATWRSAKDIGIFIKGQEGQAQNGHGPEVHYPQKRATHQLLQ